jgi:oligoribonuclease
MYRGNTRVGDVASPFARDSTIQNAIKQAESQIVTAIRSVEEPMFTDSYFRMASEIPYSHRTSPRSKPASGVEKIDLSGNDNIAWIDMEMSGLDPVKNTILEIAMVITDGNLNLVAEHETLTINQSEQTISEFNEWCRINHERSGLTQRVRESKTTIQDAELELAKFTKRFCHVGRTCLAGNSVYVDKMFLAQHMPFLNSCFHYRVIDVSSVNELCKRWRSDLHVRQPTKLGTHRARMDIYESIRELMFYRKHFFVKK